VRLGITLPQFREAPEPMLAVARDADAAGLDGVFLFDHLFRVGRDGARRPALECVAMLGAVASETRRVTVGTLVARATLRPPATLAHALRTVSRLADGRLVAGLGAGDSESRIENESFGLGFGTVESRVGALRLAVEASRGHGFPVWVGGKAVNVGHVAAEAEGWNRWGVAADTFAAEAAAVRRMVRAIGRDSDRYDLTWGGLVVLGATDRDANAKAERLEPGPGTIVGGPERVADALRAVAAAGASWAIVGPVDSADPDNVGILGESVAPLLR
jgi:alkanesulfonate monooxygenase SsuD/methylene tetrahydromethanopterin reductase-like flavin-dependent oxidoreductase (luciferase family)